MAISASNIARLILQESTGMLTPDEQELLRGWKDASEENRAKYASLQQFHSIRSKLNDYRLLEKETESMLVPDVSDLSYSNSTPVIKLERSRSWILRWRWVAALLVIASGVSIWMYTESFSKKELMVHQVPASLSDVLPGNDRAILTLADGRQIVLDSLTKGRVAVQGNVSVVKTADGGIQYNPADQANDVVMINTISTPRGGQFQLTLPDGSKVWLNAASSITYPAAFIGMDRKVKMTGEVYLEIAKDKYRPFVVDVDGRSTVQVLGTHFNIHAYADESAIKTTLIEGSVKVNRSAILKPGQQAVIAGGGQSPVILEANIEQTIAWKNGLFDFDGLGVKDVMNQLSRWYDIDVRFEGKGPDFTFVGEIYRSEKLSVILNTLEKLKLKYRMEGRTLVIL